MPAFGFGQQAKPIEDTPTASNAPTASSTPTNSKFEQSRPARVDCTMSSLHHIVVPGDTLWDISESHLGAGIRWPEMYAANKSLIADPHWIYPGQRFTLPSADACADRDTAARFEMN